MFENCPASISVRASLPESPSSGHVARVSGSAPNSSNRNLE